MDNFPTLYKVSYWAEDVQKTLTSYGILYAGSPREAIDQLADWYGEEEISAVSFHMLESGLFEMSEDQYLAALKKY